MSLWESPSSGKPCNVRVLITGSRNWTNQGLIQWALTVGTRHFAAAEVTVVHGACPDGADDIADRLAVKMGLTIERYPADWKLFGRRAGFVRNMEMVNTRPDVCLAFIRNSSRGASMCANLAEQAGIPTHRYTEDSP